ncbi:hypothetical protein WN48_09437 [Eufriesea mexicana]|uniref:Uncharacterized protein n=1 Tax=Eufriesea mexicana TaxID=516756 RepID=A0A310SEA3_9HYME|nr:hypothetical protein WN48_09437 [Eufriesea mexicana]
MRQAEDAHLLDIIQREIADNFDSDRHELRKIAKENLLKIQEENRRGYGRNCKAPTKYAEGDLVVIKKTQFEPSSKLKARYLGRTELPRSSVTINMRCFG